MYLIHAIIVVLHFVIRTRYLGFRPLKKIVVTGVNFDYSMMLLKVVPFIPCCNITHKFTKEIEKEMKQSKKKISRAMPLARRFDL